MRMKRGRSHDCQARKQEVILIGAELAPFQDEEGSRGAGEMA